MLKLFGMFVVKFDFKWTDKSMYMPGIYIKCVNCKKQFISIWKNKNRDHIIVFIKDVFRMLVFPG